MLVVTCAQGLTLDAVVPSGLGALLPNLRCLILAYCQLTPAPRTTVLDCPNLQHVIIEVLSVNAPKQHQQAVTTAQLRQLAKLPSLSHVRLADSSCPTLFLAALGTQLTRLRLHASFQRWTTPATAALAPSWRATLQYVARCTNLRELDIPCSSPEELQLMAPALQHVRTLRLNCNVLADTDGDAMMEALLGLPHLTSLRWHACAMSPFRRSYLEPDQEHARRWERLQFGTVTPQQLARLPLRSLKHPVQWHALEVTADDLGREVRAMMANLTRGCPAGYRWQGSAYCPTEGAELWFGGGVEDVAAALATLQPLLASVVPLAAGESFVVGRVAWRVAYVQALGRLLPRTCTWLRMQLGATPRDALKQFAVSLPWLRQLELKWTAVLPQAVVGYVRAIKRIREEHGMVVGLERVVVREPDCPTGMSAALHKRLWEEAARQVERLAAGVELVLDLP